MKKRVISLLLCFIMLFPAIPLNITTVNADTSSTYYYKEITSKENPENGTYVFIADNICGFTKEQHTGTSPTKGKSILDIPSPHVSNRLGAGWILPSRLYRDFTSFEDEYISRNNTNNSFTIEKIDSTTYEGDQAYTIKCNGSYLGLYQEDCGWYFDNGKVMYSCDVLSWRYNAFPSAPTLCKQDYVDINATSSGVWFWDKEKGEFYTRYASNTKSVGTYYNIVECPGYYISLNNAAGSVLDNVADNAVARVAWNTEPNGSYNPEMTCTLVPSEDENGNPTRTTFYLRGLFNSNEVYTRYEYNLPDREAQFKSFMFHNAYGFFGGSLGVTNKTDYVSKVTEDGVLGHEEVPVTLYKLLQNPKPTITTTSLDNGTAGTFYSQTLSATCDDPVTWSIESGSLPNGLSLNSTTGVISGTPTTGCALPVTIKATSGASLYDTVNLSIQISCNLVSVSNPSAINNVPNGTSLSDMPFPTTVSITTSTGTMDAHVDWIKDSINPKYDPGKTESQTFTITGSVLLYGYITNTNNVSNKVTLTVTVNRKLLSPNITTTELDKGKVGTAYSQTLSATGDGTITWSIDSGKLPDGLTLNNATGEISGTPSAIGKYSVTIMASSEIAPAAIKEYTMTVTTNVTGVSPLPDITNIENGTALSDISLPNTVELMTGAGKMSTSITWDLTSANPVYNPSNSASQTFTLTGSAKLPDYVTDTYWFSTNVTQKITVDKLPVSPSITTTSLGNGTLGTEYSQTLAATGDGTITWSIDSGKLPDGLSLNPTTGVISGKPTTLGLYQVTLKASGSVAPVDTKAFVFSITSNLVGILAPPDITGIANGTAINDIALPKAVDIETSAAGTIKASVYWNRSLTTPTYDPSNKESQTFTISGLVEIPEYITNTNRISSTITQKITVDRALVKPTITTTALSIGKAKTEYSCQIQATGDAQITYSITEGSLPKGLTLNPQTGYITGKAYETGTFELTVQAANSVSNDTKTFSLTINPLALAGCSISYNGKTYPSNYTYTGSAKKPVVVIKDASNSTLKQGTDYSVTYSNNIYPGKAKITILGKGCYAGTIMKEFTIFTPKVAAQKTVTASLYGHDDVKLSWSSQKVTGAKVYYKVEYKKSTASRYYVLSSKTTATSMKKANLADGTKYYFKVTPYVVVNGVTYTGTAKTASLYMLKKLSIPKISRSSTNYIKIIWTNIAGESGYQIAKSSYKTKSFKVIKTISSTSATSVKLKVTRKKNYYYKTRVYRTVNGTKIYGPWSTVKSYKLK